MDIRTRVIIDCMVTDSAVADINGLYVMPGRLGRGTGDFCLDSAYLARLMCNMISAMGCAPHQAKVQHRTQRQGKPVVARDGEPVHG